MLRTRSCARFIGCLFRRRSAGMGDGRRHGTSTASSRRFDARHMGWIPIVVLVAFGLLPPRSARRPLAGLGGLVCFACDGILSQPARSQRPPEPSPRSSGMAATDRTADVGLLRGLCWCGGSLAPTRQLPGVSVRRSPTGFRRRTKGCLLPRPSPPAISAISGRSTGRSWERSLTIWTSSIATAGTSTTGTTRLTLEPLLPRYVSTADSGNLAACFLTVTAGIAELLNAPMLAPSLAEGYATA